MAYDMNRRNEIARGLGFRSYSAQRKAAPTDVARRRESLKAANAGTFTGKRGRNLHKLTPTGKVRRRQVTATPNQTTVDTRSAVVVHSQLEKAARAGRQVKASVTFATVKRYGLQGATTGVEIGLFSHGGFSARELLDMIDDPERGSGRTPGDVFGVFEMLANRLPGVDGAKGVERVHLDLYDAPAAREQRDAGLPSIAEEKRTPARKVSKAPAKKARPVKKAAKKAPAKRATRPRKLAARRKAAPGAGAGISDLISGAEDLLSGAGDILSRLHVGDVLTEAQLAEIRRLLGER